MNGKDRARPRLYTIPPDADFLPALARAMLSGDLPAPGGKPPAPHELADWTVFLPSRRAARALSAALLEQAPSQSQILARIHPLGDVDEDELALAAAADDPAAALPPAIQPLPRRFLLARLINEWAEEDDSPLAALIRDHPGEAMKMAQALAALLDSFENGEIPFSEISRLLQRESPQHRLAARSLLRHVRQRYPEELKKAGLMGAAARRSELIHAQARLLAASPPAAPVIAAGSTGTIPAAAALMDVIARLPAGCVVLPGLDREMDEESWRALPPGHPQYGMKLLLERMRAHPSEVEDLPGLSRPESGPARVRLLSEAMRPAETAHLWRDALKGDGAKRLLAGARGLKHIHAPTRQAEALVIALIMRRALETEGRTAALVTPDRDLARQVRAGLDRWGITVDDSAGRPLTATAPGGFLKLLADAAVEGFAPEKLAALAAHPFACFGLPRDEFLHDFSALELAVLRHLAVFPGVEGLERAVRRRCREAAIFPHHEHRAVRGLKDRWQALKDCARRIARHLAPLARAFSGGEARPLDELLRLHVSAAEAMTTPPEGPCPLWTHDAGEALARAIADIHAHAASAPAFTPREYAAFIASELAARPLRPRHDAHPRLSILGLLEARLVPADVMILGGLNEDVWPPAAATDPFLNRPDKDDLGLPVPERRIGLTAHDFVQAAGKRRVWLTSSARIGDQPAVESRWLLRLHALTGAAGDARALEPDEPWLAWAEALDAPLNPPRPIAPPSPAPPARLRPKRFSASRVATLIRDPYAIFGGDILQLSPLPPLACAITARELGVIIHAALEAFARDYPAALPPDPAAAINERLLAAFDEQVDDAARRAFWAPRFARMARWLAGEEAIWRSGGARVLAEQRGKMHFDVAGQTFTLSAVADRIDLLNDGSVRLMDYKTGAVPDPRPGKSDYSPQLDLEAAMLLHGAFAALPETKELAEAAYVKISGGMPPGEITSAGGGQALREQALQALAGFKALLAAYEDPAQPYLPLDHGDRERRPHDFDHLARWQEWIHAGGEERS